MSSGAVPQTQGPSEPIFEVSGQLEIYVGQIAVVAGRWRRKLRYLVGTVSDCLPAFVFVQLLMGTTQVEPPSKPRHP